MSASPLFVYVPTLHRSLAPAGLPESVAFLHPGLPGLDFWPRDFHPANYPLSPQAARACLDDLLTLGENMAQAGHEGLTPESGPRRADAMSPLEREALARFAGPDAPTEGSGERDAALRAAQATLLLAWDLEEKLLEIRGLEEKVAQSWAELNTQLHGEEAAAIQTLGATQAPPWQAVLAAMAAFLPEGSVLVSAHEDLRRQLQEDGLLRPLPQELAASLSDWDKELIAAVLWAREPLWRVLGAAKAPQDRPWLLRPHDMLLLPAREETEQGEKRA